MKKMSWRRSRVTKPKRDNAMPKKPNKDPNWWIMDDPPSVTKVWPEWAKDEEAKDEASEIWGLKQFLKRQQSPPKPNK